MITVSSILHDVLKIPKEELSIELSINSVEQWDSLAHLELMLYLEEAHSLIINEESILMSMKIALKKSNYKKVKKLSKTFSKVCETLCKENKSILENLDNIEPKNDS